MLLLKFNSISTLGFLINAISPQFNSQISLISLMDVDSDHSSPIQPADSKPSSDDDSSASLSGSVSPAAAAVAGPRHAPTYSVVNAICEKKDDGPGPRCGHTLTAVPAVGEEGSATYIGPRLILFGGATALEGNSGGGSGTGTPTSAGSAGISTFLSSRVSVISSY